MIMELDEIRWLAQLKEAEERFKEKNQILTPKIQRVPLLLRQNKKFTKYCSPKLISLGPIHHNHNHNNESIKANQNCPLNISTFSQFRAPKDEENTPMGSKKKTQGLNTYLLE